MTQQHSEVWRINRSAKENQEYVEVLRSLGRVVGALGSDIPVSYTVQGEESSWTDGKVIKICPDQLMENPIRPLPPDQFDVLTGYAIHESAHNALNSCGVAYHTSDGIRDAVSLLGEEYLADNYYQQPILKSYIQKAREATRSKLGQYEEGEKKLANLFSAYTHMIMYGETLTPSADTLDMLAVVFKHFGKLETSMTTCQREDIYKDCAFELRTMITQDEFKEKAKQRIKGKGGRATERNVGREMEAAGRDVLDEILKTVPLSMGLGGLDREKLEAIGDLMLSNSQDVTQALANMISMYTEEHGIPAPHNTELTTIARDADRTLPLLEPDKALLAALRWIELLLFNKSHVPERLLPKGKVDGRRLHRTAVDDIKVFRRTKLVIEKSRRIWLLIDGSGSMNNKQGQDLYAMSAAFKAVMGDDCRVYFYNEDSGNGVLISRADVGKSVLNVEPRGNTPSGSAILYVSSLLQSEGGGVLIHFTDGGANVGLDTNLCLKVVSDKHRLVELINIVPYNHEAHYGNDLARIETIPFSGRQTFPEILTRELKRIWGVK